MVDRRPGENWDAAPNRGHFVVDRGELLSVEDEVRVKAMSQALYRETGGWAAFVVITAPSLRAGGAGDAPLSEFLPRLFKNVGLTESEISDGLLVFVSEPDRQAGILVTPDWPAELRDQIEGAFRTQTLAALSEGQASRGIAELTERFDEIVRGRESAGADHERLAAP